MKECRITLKQVFLRQIARLVIHRPAWWIARRSEINNSKSAATRETPTDRPKVCNQSRLLTPRAAMEPVPCLITQQVVSSSRGTIRNTIRVIWHQPPCIELMPVALTPRHINWALASEMPRIIVRSWRLAIRDWRQIRPEKSPKGAEARWSIMSRIWGAEIRSRIQPYYLTLRKHRSATLKPWFRRAGIWGWIVALGHSSRLCLTRQHVVGTGICTLLGPEAIWANRRKPQGSPVLSPKPTSNNRLRPCSRQWRRNSNRWTAPARSRIRSSCETRSYSGSDFSLKTSEKSIGTWSRCLMTR